MTDTTVYGYFGKLPFAGDFLRRGLSAGFTTAMDRWLQGVIVTARAQIGEDHWAEIYFSAPIWRFSVAPGLLGPGGAAGIVMPSIDRVGRQFPFCIATETALPPVAANLALQPVVDRLERLALAMIEEDALPAQLEDRLASLPPMAQVEPGVGAQTGSLWVASGTDQSRVLFLPAMPSAEEEVAALFDLNAPYWTKTPTARHLTQASQ